MAVVPGCAPVSRTFAAARIVSRIEERKKIWLAGAVSHPVVSESRSSAVLKTPWTGSRLPGHVLSPVFSPYGTIFVAGSLHGPGPAAPIARTRTHTR
jgi:hypothetical protein